MNDKEKSLKAGTGTRRITPPIGVAMGGFAFRDRGCEGVRDDLHVRSLWLEGPTGRVLFLALDLVAIDVETIADWKAAIGERWGLGEHEILINESHTHSGPLVAKRFYGPNPRDEDYMQLLKERVLEAVAESSHVESECTLSFGRTELHLGISRRKLTAEGGVTWAPYPAGYVERDFPVMVVRDRQGAPICVVCSATAHPSILGDYLISAEYPGVACRLIEESLGGRVMAMFLQGAAGDVKVVTNADVAGGRWRKGTYGDVQRAGGMVASAALQVIEEGMEPVRPILKARMKSAQLPTRLKGDPVAFYKEGGYVRSASDAAPQDVMERWTQYHLGRLEKGEEISPYLPCPVQVVRIAEGVEFVAVSGELTSGLAGVLREAFPENPFMMLGYSNGLLCYVPSEQMLEEGGYEAYRSVFYRRDMPAPFAPGLEGAFVDTVTELLQALS